MGQLYKKNADTLKNYIRALQTILEIPEEDAEISLNDDMTFLLRKAAIIEEKYMFGGKPDLGTRLTETSRKLAWEYGHYDMAVVLIRDGIGTFDNTAEAIINGNKKIIDCDYTSMKIDIVPDNWNPQATRI